MLLFILLGRSCCLPIGVWDGVRILWLRSELLMCRGLDGGVDCRMTIILDLDRWRDLACMERYARYNMDYYPIGYQDMVKRIVGGHDVEREVNKNKLALTIQSPI